MYHIGEKPHDVQVYTHAHTKILFGAFHCKIVKIKILKRGILHYSIYFSLQVKTAPFDGWSNRKIKDGSTVLPIPVTKAYNSTTSSSSGMSGNESYSKGSTYIQRQQFRQGRHCMNKRLEKIETQHVAELVSALKKANCKMFCTEVFGIFVSEHLVFLTSLSVSMEGEQTRLRMAEMKRLLKSNDYDEVNGSMNTWLKPKASTNITCKFELRKTPLPLNLFHEAHMKALTKYLRYLFAHRIEKSYNQIL